MKIQKHKRLLVSTEGTSQQSKTQAAKAKKPNPYQLPAATMQSLTNAALTDRDGVDES